MSWAEFPIFLGVFDRRTGGAAAGGYIGGWRRGLREATALHALVLVMGQNGTSTWFKSEGQRH